MGAVIAVAADGSEHPIAESLGTAVCTSCADRARKRPRYEDRGLLGIALPGGDQLLGFSRSSIFFLMLAAFQLGMA